MRPFLTVQPETPVAEVASVLQCEGLEAVPVGGAENIIGIATSEEVEQSTKAAGCNPDAMPVEEIVVPVIAMCSEEDEVEEVLARMKAKNEDSLVVRDAEGKFTGSVSLKALLEATKGVSR